jgi:hypothetical protein
MKEGLGHDSPFGSAGPMLLAMRPPVPTVALPRASGQTVLARGELAPCRQSNGEGTNFDGFLTPFARGSHMVPKIKNGRGHANRSL